MAVQSGRTEIGREHVSVSTVTAQAAVLDASRCFLAADSRRGHNR